MKPTKRGRAYVDSEEFAASVHLIDRKLVADNNSVEYIRAVLICYAAIALCSPGKKWFEEKHPEQVGFQRDHYEELREIVCRAMTRRLSPLWQARLDRATDYLADSAA